MSDLSGSSTLAEVQQAFDDNASYAEDNDLTKAKRFLTAARILLRRAPSTATKGSNQIGFRIDLIRDELLRAQEWVEARDPDYQVGPSVVFPDFNDFRNP